MASLAMFTAVTAPDAILVFAETAPVANLAPVTAPSFNLLVTTFPDAILALAVSYTHLTLPTILLV